jgi:hypothetical protein
VTNQACLIIVRGCWVCQMASLPQHPLPFLCLMGPAAHPGAGLVVKWVQQLALYNMLRRLHPQQACVRNSPVKIGMRSHPCPSRRLRPARAGLRMNQPTWLHMTGMGSRKGSPEGDASV